MNHNDDEEAFKKDLNADLLEDTPHGLACLIITVDGEFELENNISSPANISL